MEIRKTRYHAVSFASDAESGKKVIQSVDRALSIMEALSSTSSPMMLGDLANATEINISTCHHLLNTLVQRGYVVYAGRSKGYVLSSKLGDLSKRASREFDLVDFVRIDLKELNMDLREAVHMSVLRGSVLLTQARLPSLMPTSAEPDETRKMHAIHAAATGKAILAWLPETELARVVEENGLTRFTDNTITSLPELVEELRLVRRSGFSIDDEEVSLDLVCYGAAIRDATGSVIASIGVSIPKSRATENYRTYIARAVVRCAKELSDRMRVGNFRHP
jgi:IclR family transcriptional regulator, acetate operon repressor